MRYLKWLNPQSPVQEYLSWIENSGDETLFQRKYQEIINQQRLRGECFLSIIIRTQGKRNEMLQDALMCLLAQTDQDFEVIIVCHRAENEDYDQLRKLMMIQPEELKKRTLLIRSEEGERGAPINLGFAYARGSYAVCLDDDDLVMDHWVESFHRASQEHQGMILRSWAVMQPWNSWENESDGRMRITAAGSPDARHCIPYHTLHEQAENMCPFMTMAFPLFLFRHMHILMNEELTTTEDWDYILRTAGIAGIYDIQEVTAIYRLWNTKDASRNLIREKEWTQNYQEIILACRNDPILLPRAEVSRYRDELSGMNSMGEKGRSCFFQEAILFWSDGEESFSDQQHAAARIQMTDDEIRADFMLKSELHAQRIRIDPTPESLFILEDIEVRVFSQEQVIHRFTLDEIGETNGIIEGNQVLFLTERPMMVFDAGESMAFDCVGLRTRVSYRGIPSLTKQAMTLSADERWLSENRRKAHLYWDRGEGFSTAQSMEFSPSIQRDRLWVDFDLSGQVLKGIRQIRFDPTEAGMIWLNHLRMTLTYADGTEETLSTGKELDCNGFFTKDGAAFLARDPYFVFRTHEAPVRFTAEAEVRSLKAAEAETLFSEAVRVPNYEETIRQLNQARDEQWMEEKTDDGQSEE